MTKPLFIESYPQALAGQQETLLELLTQLRELGIQPEIAVPKSGLFVEKLNKHDFITHVLPQPERISEYGGAIYRQTFTQKIKMGIQVFKYIVQISKFIKKNKYSVVYCNDLRGLLTVGVAARFCGIPVVIWDKLDKPHGVYDWIQLPIATKNLIIAEGISKKYPRWQKIVWAKKIQVVRDGIDINRFTPTLVSEKCSIQIQPGAFVLTTIGTICVRKGHDILVEAFLLAKVSIPNLVLFVIGVPDDASNVFAESLKLNSHKDIHWLGHRDDIPELLKHTNCLISLSRYEGMGRVNVEAMAMEVPVIGSHNTGISEVVEHDKTGFLVDIENIDEIVAAIEEVAKHPARTLDMGKLARYRAETCFNKETQIKKVIEALIGA